jgi:ABC-type tungstate transport system substrate-binding protein
MSIKEKEERYRKLMKYALILLPSNPSYNVCSIVEKVLYSKVVWTTIPIIASKILKSILCTFNFRHQPNKEAELDNIYNLGSLVMMLIVLFLLEPISGLGIQG